MKLVRVSLAVSVALAFAVGILAFAAAPGAALAASAAPCATLTLDPADPASVVPGGTVTINGAVTSCATKTERVTITYQATGPCADAETYVVQVTLQAGEARTASGAFTAPSCPGVYTITGTAAAGATVLSSASTTVTVQ